MSKELKVKKEEYKLNRFKGITLISLVITIVVLIILASVVIHLGLSDNGIFERSKQAKKLYGNATQKEQEQLNELYGQLLIASDGTINNISLEKLQTIIQNEVNKAVTSSTGNPTGTIIAYSVDNVPTGYLKCEGQEISRTDYNNLFNIIGTTYGDGDGSTTFNVPDLRGEFLRGTGTNSHTNQGNGSSVGTHQDATNIPFTFIASSGNFVGPTESYPSNTDHGKLVQGQGRYTSLAPGSACNTTRAYTARPTNTSVLYCIKY